MPNQTNTRDLFGWVMTAVVIVAVLWIWLSPGDPDEPAIVTPEQPEQTIASAPDNLTATAPQRNALNSDNVRDPVPPSSQRGEGSGVGGGPAQVRQFSSTTTNHATNPAPRSSAPGFTPRPVANDFETQLALARRGFSPGSIDGVLGPQTRAALMVFQQENRLPQTGVLTEATSSRLLIDSPPLRNYIVQPADLARLRPVSPTWLGKSQQDRLEYESILELVAELGHASPNHITRLNPSVDWNSVGAGARITIPAIEVPAPEEKAAFVRIHLASRTLQAFDLRTNIIAHFPCSIAARVDKRPVGKLHVAVVIKDPDYTFNPEIFPESAEARQIKRKLVIPPGPNNPVGVAWIGLDKPGYGIHGTPVPESVGRTESHGCFRLANWNAEHLRRLAWVGMPVFVEP